MKKKTQQFIFSLVVCLFMTQTLMAQTPETDYENPREYAIGKITVSGVKYLSNNETLVKLSGLTPGDTIRVPGEEISKAIDKLWQQNLFSDVRISVTNVSGMTADLDIFLQEQPRLSQIAFSGLKKSEVSDLEEDLPLRPGSQITEHQINNTKIYIKKYFYDKGYHYTQVNITQKDDTAYINHVILNIHVAKREKVKIESIIIEGNEAFSDQKIKRAMKDTKEKSLRNMFRSAKYIEADYKNDKKKIIEKYNKQGYRDAHIANDTVYSPDLSSMVIKLRIDEGRQYFFRDISWVGNTKHSSELLSKILGIEKGDVYDEEHLDNRLSMDMDAVSNIYLDDGYLFFNVTPVEVNIDGDSIDLELRIYEGKQARVNRITITGNDRTKDHVIRRELYTRPGQLFSKSNITRSIRELAQLGHFDPEKLNINPVPDPVNGTVDLEYIVEEKSNDQVELSGGWGAGMLIGTLGLRFNNFAIGDVFKKGAWRPVPSGSGQQASVRFMTNGPRYRSFSLSFVEPWLGGKKPNSLSISTHYTLLSNGYDADHPNHTFMKIWGASVGLGKRLKWPDDYFTLYTGISYQQYELANYGGFIITEGNSRSISLQGTFARNSIDAPLYSRRGSQISLSLQATPPYSLFSTHDYAAMEDEDRYRWIEYHKWSFKADWYTQPFNDFSESWYNDFVIHTKVEYGFLGYYNKLLISPFEAFYVGGDGMSGYNSFYGRDVVALRGYEHGSLTPYSPTGTGQQANLYAKYTAELRYPISLNPQATIYALVFAEAGNGWYNFHDFSPFNVNRSAGVGVRFFLPMLGLLGFDWGYGFDETPYAPGSGKGQFHFIIGQQF